MSHHHWKQCFDNDCSYDTFKCTKSACFGAESTRSRTAILSATCPVVCCAMLGCEQVGSVVWRVTSVHIEINISRTQSVMKILPWFLCQLGRLLLAQFCANLIYNNHYHFSLYISHIPVFSHSATALEIHCLYGTVASNHLQGPHRESPKAMRSYPTR